MAVLLSLLAALSYGLADFCGGMASKRASAWGVALVASATGAVLVLAATLVLGGEPTAADLWWGAAAGVGNGFGTAFLYRGLSSGRMGVVAPVSGVGAAVIPVAVGVLLGERPDPLVWVGILLALPAIWLVARDPSGSPAAAPGGVVDGALAGLGFGFLFVALAQVGDDAGLLPLAVNQVVAGVVIVLVATALRQPWRPQRAGLLGGAAAGVLGRRRHRVLPARDPRGLPQHRLGRDLALPGVHRDPGRDPAPRARPPRPGSSVCCCARWP